MRNDTLKVYYPNDSVQFMIGGECMGSRVVSFIVTDEVALVALKDGTTLRFRNMPTEHITYGGEV